MLNTRQTISAGHGFTLIEVLIALAILTIALTSVYRLQSQTVIMSARARFYSTAPLLAQARLAQIENDKADEIANGAGDFGPQYPGYSWSLETDQVTTDLLDNLPYRLLRIELTVILNDEERYSVRTYRVYAD